MISYIADELTTADKKKMKTWVKEDIVNIFHVTEHFAEDISECLLRRERDSINAIRQAVDIWAIGEMRKAAL